MPCPTFLSLRPCAFLRGMSHLPRRFPSMLWLDVLMVPLQPPVFEIFEPRHPRTRKGQSNLACLRFFRKVRIQILRMLRPIRIVPQQILTARQSPMLLSTTTMLRQLPCSYILGRSVQLTRMCSFSIPDPSRSSNWASWKGWGRRRSCRGVGRLGVHVASRASSIERA